MNGPLPRKSRASSRNVRPAKPLPAPVTDDDIRALWQESMAAGDSVTAGYCETVFAGVDSEYQRGLARKLCEDTIRAARAAGEVA